MLIPYQNRPWLRKARFLVFAFNLAHTVYLITNVRARGVAASLGIGLIAAWSTIYILALIVCNDPQREFMRIERMVENSSNEAQNGKAGVEKGEEGQETNGTVNGVAAVHEHKGPSQRHGEFYWQPYPITPFRERLDWVLGTFSSFFLSYTYTSSCYTTVYTPSHFANSSS